VENVYWDLSKLVLKRKKKYLNKRTKLVGISNWIYQEAKKSILFKDHDIRLIHNNVSTDEYFPISKSLAKQILGISPNKKLVLTGSLDLYQPWKGFDLFENALKNINTNDFEIYLFGAESKNILYKSFGLLHDTISLRLAYSAADVFVAPSRMEAFGKTLTEAMACGTPVVCFDATGPKDIVEHKRTGYKAKPFDTKDLAEGINWVLKLNHAEYQNYCRQARERVLKYFDTRVIASQYTELYKDMLSEKK
jgi:glycosyltransferase involved in cell wall biosynthesis